MTDGAVDAPATADGWRRQWRDARDHLGAERGRQGHDHRRAARAAPRPGVPLRRDLHDPRAATRRGRRRRLPLPRPRDVRRAQRAAGEFLEANKVHGNWYGTPRSQVREALAAGRDVILKIDVQGAQVVKEKVPGALLIFLVPPSLEDLFQRLRSRATETADELELRQRNAAIELARQEDYDYVVTNETGQVERTAERIDEIIAEEHRRHPDRRVGVYPRSP